MTIVTDALVFIITCKLYFNYYTINEFHTFSSAPPESSTAEAYLEAFRGMNVYDNGSINKTWRKYRNFSTSFQKNSDSWDEFLPNISSIYTHISVLQS